METLILSFGYKARRGKGTAVQTIIAARGGQYDIREYSFAHALKLEVNQAAEAHGGMLGLFTAMASQLPNNVQYDPQPDMTDPLCPLGKQRALLQWWGTEFRRRQDPFYWVKKLRNQIRDEQPRVGLIGDMRFLNEFAWVKQNQDNRVIRLDRVGFEESQLITSTQSKHQSECELDAIPAKGWDYILAVADGDVEGLKRDAVFIFDHVVESLMPKPEIAEFPDKEITEFIVDESKEEGIITLA